MALSIAIFDFIEFDLTISFGDERVCDFPLQRTSFMDCLHLIHPFNPKPFRLMIKLCLFFDV